MIVYVAGYPKSGTTWITRLFGDALNCRTGGSISKEDQNEIATEGLDRSWDLTIRKGHFILSDETAAEPVTKAHTIKWKALRPEDHRVVFVVRDPRDIAVSAAYHWNIPVDSSLQNMAIGTNNFRFCGSWKSYVNEWLTRLDRLPAVIVRYEDMLISPGEFLQMLSKMGFVFDQTRAVAAYRRQSFANRLVDVKKNGHEYPRGKDFNLKFMRKGIAGDWRNHFNRTMAFDAETHFSELLQTLGYESSSTWWKEIE